MTQSTAASGVERSKCYHRGFKDGGWLGRDLISRSLEKIIFGLLLCVMIVNVIAEGVVENIDGQFDVKYFIKESARFSFGFERCSMNLLLEPEVGVSFTVRRHVDYYFWDYLSVEDKAVAVVSIHFDDSIQKHQRSMITVQYLCPRGEFNMIPSSFSIQVQNQNDPYFKKTNSSTSAISVTSSFNIRDNIITKDNKLMIAVAGRNIRDAVFDHPMKLYGPSSLKYEVRYVTLEKINVQMPKIEPSLKPYYYTLKRSSLIPKGYQEAGYAVMYSNSIDYPQPLNLNNSTWVYHLPEPALRSDFNNHLVNVLTDSYFCLCSEKSSESSFNRLPSKSTITSFICHVEPQCKNIAVVAKLKELPYPNFLYAQAGSTYNSPAVCQEIKYIILLPAHSIVTITNIELVGYQYCAAKVTLGDSSNNYATVEFATKQSPLQYSNSESSNKKVFLVIEPVVHGLPTSIIFSVKVDQIPTPLEEIITGAISVTLVCLFMSVAVGVVYFVIKRNQRKSEDLPNQPIEL